MFLSQRSHLSAADLFAFTQVLQNFSELHPYQKSQFPHLYRWILQVQEMEGISEILEELGFSLVDEIPYGLQPVKPKGLVSSVKGKAGGKKKNKKKKKNKQKDKKVNQKQKEKQTKDKKKEVNQHQGKSEITQKTQDSENKIKDK